MGSVVWLVMREVLLLLGLGLAAGIPAALGLGRFISAQLYGIEANDPWVAGSARTECSKSTVSQPHFRTAVDSTFTVDEPLRIDRV